MNSAGIFFLKLFISLKHFQVIIWLTAMISSHRECLVGISKPTVFTGASAMFLLVYLTLWKYHNRNNPLLGGQRFPPSQ